MASSPITSWQIEGENVEVVTDFLILGSKITADGDCFHETRRCLLLGQKAMTNIDHVLKSRDITLPTEVCIVKAVVFPVVLYGCESWMVKKAEHQRTDVFELRCWRRFLKVLWTAKRSNQSILRETNPEYWLEGLMLRLKLQYLIQETWVTVTQNLRFLHDSGRGIAWGGRREGGSGWEIHVNPWLIHVNVWQKPLQYCKVISLQLIKINLKKEWPHGHVMTPNLYISYSVLLN